MRFVSKKSLFYILILAIFYLWGIFTIKENIFPFKLIKFIDDKFFDEKNISNEESQINNNQNDSRIAIVRKYKFKQDIWRDRTYFNKKNDILLDNFFIVEITRHLESNLNIEFLDNVYVYRATCKKNDNSRYSKKNGWEKSSFDLYIEGNSCVHKKVYRKKYTKGIYKILPGGPITSDPIFIKGAKDLSSILIK